MYNWVTDNVVAAVNEHGSNTYCVAQEDELFFVDAGMLHGYTSKFRVAMENHFGLRASTLFVTHSHIDHILAMNVFRDCEIIAARAARQRFEAHRAIDFNEERLSRMEAVFPHIREGVRDGGIITPTVWVGSRERFGDIVFNVHGGHTACSSSVYVPSEESVALGDLVQSERPPYFGEPDTDISAWVGTLNSWSASNVEHVLPGHGPTVPKSYLSEVSGYFDELVESLTVLKKSGVAEENVEQERSLPSGYWPRYAVKKPAHYYSIRQLYSSL